jgi:hypothetical protein
MQLQVQEGPHYHSQSQENCPGASVESVAPMTS